MTIRALNKNKAKAIDSRVIEKLGISTLVMMENAGIRVADFILEILKKKKNKKVVVFCGKGNNAGDGLVVSRQLLCDKAAVDTFMLCCPESLSPAARTNLEILKKMGKRVRQIRTETDLGRIKFSCYSLLIDAIFGIGLKGRVEGIFKKTIQKINSSGVKTVVSIDIPSGLDADRGIPLGQAVRANYTVTLTVPKRGLLVNQGPRFSGKLIIRHIGFPQRIIV